MATDVTCRGAEWRVKKTHVSLASVQLSLLFGNVLHLWLGLRSLKVHLMSKSLNMKTLLGTTCLLAATLFVGLGCNSGGSETAEDVSQFEVASSESPDDNEEPTISSLAELAGVSSSEASGSELGGDGNDPLSQPPSMTGTDLDAEQLALPEGGINQIQAFLQQIYRRRGTVSTEEEAIELLQLQRQAADRLMAPGVDEVTRVNAILIKLDAMRTLAAMRVPDADTSYLDYCALLEKDQNPVVNEQGRIRAFEIQSVWYLNDREGTSYEDIHELLTDLVNDPALTQDTITVVQEFAQRVFRSSHRDKGAELLSVAAEAFARSDNEYVKSAGESFLDQLLLAQLELDLAQEAVFDGEEGAADELFNRTLRLITERSPSPFTLDRAHIGARTLELNHHYELSKQLFQEIANQLADVENEDLKLNATRVLERANLRMGLLGQVLNIDGDLQTGKPFDRTPYAGKIVLVFCWASYPQWGGALQEVEKMKELYDRYRDQGFEIIGLNADEVPQELSFFLNQNPMPWATVVTNDAESVGLESPMFRAMGIDASPFNLLLNQDGEVVQLHLYGDELEPAIAAALGVELAEPASEGSESREPAPGQQGENEGNTQDQPSEPMPAATDNTGGSAPQSSIGTGGYHFVSLANEMPVDEEAIENPYLAPAHYTTDDLVDFLFDMEEKPRSLQGRTDFVDALVDAADRVLADSEARTAYIRIASLNKLQALHRMAILETPGYEDRLRQAVQQLSKVNEKQVVAEVQFLALEAKAIEATELDDESRKSMLETLRTFFTETVPQQKHLRLASATVAIINGIDNADAPKDAATEREKWYGEFGKLFAESKDKQLAGYGRQLAKPSSAETSSVVGEVLALEGDSHAGLPFDWEAYRGKVVVVDFWATWCGPCLRELPNVQKAYSELNDQGFEIVGISIDQDLDALTEFLDREALPWPTLSGEKAQAKARELGVRAIPTMMLIDRDGKIVQVANRIEQLRPLINQLLEK
jgi:thiol-disulfide isomerase/thioredoxin